MTASRLRITAAVCTSLLAVLAIGVDRASAFPPGTPSIPSPGGGGYQPSRPTYTRPTTPSYTRPTTPRYTRPTTPGYTRPTTPNYTNPNRPNYTNPNRPGYTTPGARNRLGQHNRYTPGRTPRTGLSGQPNRTTPGQPYQPRPGQPWQTAPVPGLSPHQRNQSNQHMQPWRQPGRTNPYGTGNVPEVSQPSVPFSSDWFAPQERSYKPLYHDKGKPRFKWRIHPDLRVLLVLIPAIIVILLMLRPVIWKYVSALRQIRKAQAESLVSIQKWRRQLSRSGADQPGQDILDNSQWDALIGSLKSSGASTKISSKLRMLTARTTLGYLGLLGCYIALVGGVGWGLWQLSPFSTILPNKLLDSIPWLAGMIAVAAFGGGWFVILLYPFVIRQQDGSVSIPLEPERAPELHKLIAAVAGHFNTPVPHEVHISALPTACISRRYLFLRRRWRLTVGLPFFSMLTPRQMVALLSHELTHTKQNHYLELSIRTDGAGNGFVECFNRLSWVRSLPSTPFGALCETLVLAPTLLIFRGMACASLYLSRKLSRELEFHADQQMACLLSPEEYEEFMNRLGRSQLAMHLSFQKLSEIYHLKTLPDNLPELIRHNDRTMPPQTPTALQKEQRKQKTLWFDTHPTDAERVAAVKAIRPYPKASLPNIFDDLSTATLIPNIRQAEALATIAHYRENIGEDYSTDLLKPTQDIIARFQSRFEAMGALNRLLGRWALPQIPIEIIDTPSIPENATFDQCTEQVQAYRQWRLDHTEQLAKSTDTLQSVFTEGIMLYFVELVNAAVPSMHSIANKHLLMTRARALQAVAMRGKSLVAWDLYEEQHKQLNSYFQAISRLLTDHGRQLQTADLESLHYRCKRNMTVMTEMQEIQPVISAVRIKFGMVAELIQLARSSQPGNPPPQPQGPMSAKLRTVHEFIGFVDGRITRMICLMGKAARKAMSLTDQPDIIQMAPRLETLAKITFETIDDYTGDALEDAAWMLHCLAGIYRNALSELAQVGWLVEEALGMDVSADNFASEHMKEQLAFHIV